MAKLQKRWNTIKNTTSSVSQHGRRLSSGVGSFDNQRNMGALPLSFNASVDVGALCKTHYTPPDIIVTAELGTVERL